MTDHTRIVVSAPGRNRRRWRAEPSVLDWETFADWVVSGGTGTGGKYGRPYSPVTLAKTPGRRQNVNLVVRHVLTLDADFAGEDYLDRLDEALPCAALSHTTASHTPEKPKWRTLVPVSRALTPTEAKTLSGHLIALVGRERFDRVASTSPIAVAYAPAWAGVEYHKRDGEVLDADAWLAVAPSVEWSASDPVGAVTVEEFLAEHEIRGFEDLPDCRYGRSALSSAVADLEAVEEGTGVHHAIYHAAARGVELVEAGCWSVRDLDALRDVALTLRAVRREHEFDEALASALARDTESRTGCQEHGADAFFDTTPVLRHVRQAAHSRGIPAAPVLLGCLNRVLLRVPPTVTLPPVVGSRASLNLGTVALGSSGATKSTADDVAAEVLGYPFQEGWVLPVGSGEGMIDAYYEFAPTGPRGKLGLVLVSDFERHRLFLVDEGETFRRLTERSGTTLAPFLRTALTGGMLGTTNSKAGGHSRRVPARSYRLCFHVSLHPSQVDILLGGENDDTGMPQRFLWMEANGDDLPDSADDLPEWPGPLDWDLPAGLEDGDVVYPASVQREIRQARLDASKGKIHPRAAHVNLTRLKVALALALLHGEASITERWWALAGVLTERSLALQTRCLAALAETVQEKHNRQEVRRARAEEAAVDDRLERAVVQVLDKVRARPVGERVSWHDARPGKALRDAVDKDDVLEAVARQAGFRVEAGTGANGREAVWVVRTA